jgi:hypothetical protein
LNFSQITLICSKSGACGLHERIVFLDTHKCSMDYASRFYTKLKELS